MAMPIAGYNINATIVLVTSASWCLGTYHLSLPLLPVERFRQYTPEELLQVCNQICQIVSARHHSYCIAQAKIRLEALW